MCALENLDSCLVCVCCKCVLHNCLVRVSSTNICVLFDHQVHTCVSFSILRYTLCQTQTRQMRRTHLQHKCVYFRMSLSRQKNPKHFGFSKYFEKNILRYTLVDRKLKLLDSYSMRVQQNDMKFWKERDWEALQEKKRE